MSDLSKSKYTMRLDSSSPEGPCDSVLSTVALALSTPLVSAVFCGGGAGCSGGLVPQPAKKLSEATRTAVSTTFFIFAP
jgi:hypothetical protein